MTKSPVYELAGQQADPLAEEILAVVFTDLPVRESVRPGDSRRHWQWWARTDRDESASRLWLSIDQPITDTTTTEIEGRVSKALAVFIPTFAKSIDVLAQQLTFDSVTLDITVHRPQQTELTIGLVLAQGGSSA